MNMKETLTEKKKTPHINNPFLSVQNAETVGDVNGSFSIGRKDKTNNHEVNDSIKKNEEKKTKKKIKVSDNNDSEDNNEVDEVSDEESDGKTNDHDLQGHNQKLSEKKKYKNRQYAENESSANEKKNIQKRQVWNQIKIKNVLNTYSSSESDTEEEENVDNNNHNNNNDDSDKKKTGFLNIKQKQETETEIHKNNTNGYLSNEKNTRKIFANVSNEIEKVVFLPKKVREENKKKLEKEMNKQMNEHRKTSKYSRENRRDRDRSSEREKEREKEKEKERERVKEIERARERSRNKRKRYTDEEEKKEEGRNEKKEGCNKEKTQERGIYSDEYKKNIQTESSLAELNMLNIKKSETENYSYKETELEIIKQHYLGLNKAKKKIQKPSEKFRNIFNFEWDPSEDTSKNDNNPLYKNRLEPQLLFGRGYIAGIDVREQRKKNNFYDRLVQNRLNWTPKRERKETDAETGTEAERDKEKEKQKQKQKEKKKEKENEKEKKTDIEKGKMNEEGLSSKKTSLSSLVSKEDFESIKEKSNIITYSSGKHATVVKNELGEYIYEPKIDNIIKDVYQKHWSEKTKEEMTDRDWRIFREDNEIYIKGGIVPPPIRTWEESNLSPDLLKAIKKAKYDKPSPIQMQAIPIALEMRDLIGIAETGSGKTAAFVLPMLSYVKQLPPLTYETSQDGPYALVIAPSRELAIQIFEETNKFASFCSCKTVAVVGGRNAETQAFELRKGAEIVIGTPGRLQDCLEKRYTVLNQCNYVILDEADRMMDMGFEETVHFILDKIPTTNLKSEDDALALKEEMMSKAGHRLYRLTQMFSATMPPSVERLSRKYLRAPAYISIGDPGAGKRSIEQKLEFITEGKKKQKLQELLETYEPPIIVFVNQKKTADIIAKTITKMKFRAASLHGGKAQGMREQTLTAFKNSEYDILVATDVAGRGIDVHGVKLVINFDMPKDIESYTHRIGRTGRAGMKGLAISFVTEFDSYLFYDLKQFLISSNNLVPLELANHPASKVKPGSVIQTPKKNQILYKN